MKAYTDLKQSKKLAKFLPLESADMGYIPSNEDDDGNTLYTAEFKSEFIFDEDCIPCWSLAALLEIIPERFFDNEGYSYDIEITKQNGLCYINYVRTDDHYSCYHSVGVGSMDTMLDACVEMILKLHERKML